VLDVTARPRLARELLNVAKLARHELGDVEPPEPVGDLARVFFPRGVVPLPYVGQHVVGGELARLARHDEPERLRCVRVVVGRQRRSAGEGLHGGAETSLLGLRAHRNTGSCGGDFGEQTELAAEADREDAFVVVRTRSAEQEDGNTRNALGRTLDVRRFAAKRLHAGGASTSDRVAVALLADTRQRDRNAGPHDLLDDRRSLR